jgi:hypothetical protein
MIIIAFKIVLRQSLPKNISMKVFTPHIINLKKDADTSTALWLTDVFSTYNAQT